MIAKANSFESFVNELGHLVLSRKVSETIKIGDDVTVTIEQVAGGRVKVGITAPRSVRVLRGEISTRPAA